MRELYLTITSRVAAPFLTGLSKYSRRALRFGCRFGGVHFSGPPHFGPLETFFGFFLLNLGSTAPNYPRRPPMRSSKAPPNQKNRGQVLPTPPNLASTPDKCNACQGYLGTSILDHHPTFRARDSWHSSKIIRADEKTAGFI